MKIYDTNRDEYTINLVSNCKEDLYPLLLLADETIEAINKYLFSSDVYTISFNNLPIGVFCLYKVDLDTIEIKNIAIHPLFQNKKIGCNVLSYIKNLCALKGYSNLIVGTADTGLNQLRFYERNGFIKFAIKHNFFIENYTEPIIENGIQLRDMVMLKYSI